MKCSATCWLLICFHGNFSWLNIGPVFPGLVQTHSGVIFNQVSRLVLTNIRNGILVSSGGLFVWLLGPLDRLGSVQQQGGLPRLIGDVFLGYGSGVTHIA